jgi:ubiquinone/menaquinone biosynthesis C-methylase UbiE
MSDKFLTWEQAIDWLRRQPDQPELVEACYYDLPVSNAAKRFEQSHEWIAIKELLAPWLPGKVLDLGAGNGISSFSFAQVGCPVTAVEPDPSTTVGLGAIKELSEMCNSPIQAVQARGESLPFEDHSFDIVYGRQVLHHASNLRQLCIEAARVLKPGGVFVATREHVISSSKDLSIFLESHPLHSLYGGENAFFLKDYCKAIKNSGLQLRLTLGPYDSEINYSPTTLSENRVHIRQKLERYTGKPIADMLLNSKTIYQSINRLRSWRDKTPGRLYSFIAYKPNTL